MRLVIFSLLILAVIGSGWLLHQATRREAQPDSTLVQDPDYFMEDFTITAMDEDGLPAYRLFAIYMEHREAQDTSELYEPKLEIYRQDREPLHITAEKAWLTENNEVALLRGKVKIRELDAQGEPVFTVDTSETRVLLVEEYAETDQYAVIVNGNTTVTGHGVRAYLKENRVEMINHEKTIVLQSDSS